MIKEVHETYSNDAEVQKRCNATLQIDQALSRKACQQQYEVWQKNMIEKFLG